MTPIHHIPFLLLLAVLMVWPGAPAAAAESSVRPGWTLVEENTMSDLTVGRPLPDGEFVVYNYGTSTYHRKDNPVPLDWMARNVGVEHDATEGKVIVINGRLNEKGVRESGVFYWNGKRNAAGDRNAEGGGRTAADAVRWEYRAAMQAGNGFAGITLTWPVEKSIWPLDGEIDIIEFTSGRRRDVGNTNIHLDGTRNSPNHDYFPKDSRGRKTHYTGVDWSQWTDVACEWIPTRYIAVFTKRPGQSAWRELCRETNPRWIPHSLKHHLTFQMEMADNTRPFAKSLKWKISRLAVYEPAKATAPVITSQPSDRTVTVGQAATFTVAASGSATLTYQWQRNGASIAGATATSYTTAPTTMTDNGDKFRCVVRNSTGSVVSREAVLTVVVKPVNRPPVVAITAPTTGTTVVVGQPVGVKATASDPDGSVAKVVFLLDGVVARTELVAPYTWTATGLATGTHILLAKATDDDGAVTTSTPVTIRVLAPPLFRAKFNFQPGDTPSIAGWLADHGETYGAHGDGLSYGWNQNVANATRERQHPSSPDRLHDRLVHLQKPEAPHARWEVAVPNGRYQVRLLGGDPSFIDSVYSLSVEGVRAGRMVPSAGAHWYNTTVTVEVRDGRLTIGNAADGVNNKLCAVDIQELP